jgi:hypothetical protein
MVLPSGEGPKRSFAQVYETSRSMRGGEECAGKSSDGSPKRRPTLDTVHLQGANLAYSSITPRRVVPPALRNCRPSQPGMIVNIIFG